MTPHHVPDLPYQPIVPPAAWDRKGLPAWTYQSDELFALERERIFLTHWQLAGHVGDVPQPGDWIGFDLMGERAVVMRGADGVVRAFHNLCRHRGARVVDGDRGHCKGAIVCPFHGWVYNLDGTLRGAAQPTSFGAMDRDAFGLKTIEMQVWHGFVFLRFAPGPQPDVATLLAAFDADFTAYGLAAALPAAAYWQSELPVNWKSIRDVDNEGYHVAMAHPGLQELYGRTYRDLCLAGDLSFSVGWFGDAPGRGWSVRNYVKMSPARPDLPAHLQKAWTYYGLFPNTVIAVTPEAIQFYQDLPLSARRTRLNGRIYRRPNETRPQRLARYLAQRIDRDTSTEDRQLSVWSDESMQSSGFSGFHLSDLEYGLRRHHDALRRVLPVMTLSDAPPQGEVARWNAEMLDRSAVSA
jgi:carnitine monooxygenase subunit